MTVVALYNSCTCMFVYKDKITLYCIQRLHVSECIPRSGCCKLKGLGHAILH